MADTRIWIIGGGFFGRKALEALGRQIENLQVTLVDQDPAVCRQLAAEGINCVCADGVAFVHQHLNDGRPDWILPMIPVHLTFLWLQRELAPRWQLIPVDLPAGLMERLPNPMAGAKGELYASNADFICPANCPEPATLCSHTRQPRPGIMHTRLRELDIPGFQSEVLISRQLAPGIGGYAANDLRQLAAAIKPPADNFLLSTACKCHAVIQAFRLNEAAGNWFG